ncbi:MAG: hypothetical protein IPQ02_03490 [Saprospiraceae bacterium]|nr:hypothetical protein [Candidatus Defluviibacterium haderslevense]
MTVKLVSDKIREKIEKYFLNTLASEEKPLLDKGLFELSGFATSTNKSEIESLHKFLKQIFPENVSESVKEISGAKILTGNPFKFGQ